MAVNVYAGSGTDIIINLNETDAEHDVLVGVFDLRDRESYIQVTLTDDPDLDGALVHIQIFNLAQDCFENNFFDFYTTDDTHIYNLRDIASNDGNDPGVVLPDDSYGFVVVQFDDRSDDNEGIGNMRMADANGFEYRTNLQAAGNDGDEDPNSDDNEWWLNFNTEQGVILSDIFAVPVSELDQFTDGTQLAPITRNYVVANVELYDLNEVLFSCVDVVFACTDGSSELIPELLEEIAQDDDDEIGQVQVGAEFGINETIPSSKGAQVVCPNNTVSAGTVFFNEEDNRFNSGDSDNSALIMFIGLNDGNGRGTFDSAWSGESIFNEGQEP